MNMDIDRYYDSLLNRHLRDMEEADAYEEALERAKVKITDELNADPAQAAEKTWEYLADDFDTKWIEIALAGDHAEAGRLIAERARSWFQTIAENEAPERVESDASDSRREAYSASHY